MRLNPHLPVLAFLLATAVPSDANLFARGTQSLAHAANRLHHRAAKRSAGLAKDLRRAFSGMYSQQELAETGGSQQVYCVNVNQANAPSPVSNSTGSSGSQSSPSGSNGTATSASARASSSGTAKHSSSTAASPSSTSAASSPWKLAKSYVSLFFAPAWHELICDTARKLVL